MRVWVACLLVAAAVAAEPEVGEKEFDKGLKSVRSLMKRGKWKKARTKIAGLLDQHREKGYVRARVSQVRELTLECAFRSQHGDPEPAKLVQGDLLKYEPRSGKIKIRFKPGKMKDWIRTKELWIYPAPFDGPHSITIRGSSYPDEGYVILVVCWDGNRGILVTPGRRGYDRKHPGIDAQMWHLRDGKRKRASALRASYVEGGKSFEVAVVVNSTKLTHYSDKKAIVRGMKHRRHWGSVGIGGLSSFTEIIVSGKCEKGWMQGLIDEENQKRRAEFKKSYKETDHLPAWLFSAGRSTAAGTKVAEHERWPLAMKGDWKKKAEEIRLLIGGGKAKAALAATESAAELPAPVRAYLTAEAQQRLGRYRKALRGFQETRSKAPKFLAAIEGEARMHAMLRESAKAATVYEDLLARYPDDAAIHVNWALILMRLARLSDADALVKGALARGVTSEQLQLVATLLQKSRHGPSFTKRFEFKTRHYHVVTDIDRTVCSEAARYLEQMYARFVNRLTRPAAGEGDQRFKVYLFSGQAGYLAYFKELTEGDATGSAGLYSPLLKQLLIWNQPRRADMMKTVRHEGFHQYLDRVLPNAPRWFNEGLAEYYENAKASRGELRVGQFREDSRATLEAAGVVPLADFFRLDDAAFMKNARLHYAQSWAIIYLLLQTDRDHKQMFKKLWAGYRDNPDHAEALATVFGAAGIAVLQNDLKRLIKKKR